MPGDDWSTVTPVAYRRGFVDSWAHRFDWRATETRLNANPHFITTIDGTQIHFLNVRSRHADAVPLLLLTFGWPGSIFEFVDIIEPLTDPDDPADAFHVPDRRTAQPASPKDARFYDILRQTPVENVATLYQPLLAVT